MLTTCGLDATQETSVEACCVCRAHPAGGESEKKPLKGKGDGRKKDNAIMITRRDSKAPAVTILIACRSYRGLRDACVVSARLHHFPGKTRT